MIKNKIQENSIFEFKIENLLENERIDKIISSKFEDYSRSFLTKLFEKECIFINNKICSKQGKLIKNNDIIKINFKKEIFTREISSTEEKNLNIKIMAEQDDFIIIYKPEGIITHPPSSQSKEFTLSDWLTNKYEKIKKVGIIDRPGIVHRLDKETSGLLIIALTNEAHHIFTNMFKNREIKKTYIALIEGYPQEDEGIINYSISRHPILKNKMFASSLNLKNKNSRDALTKYKVLKNFNKEYSLVEIYPYTGRTHQIRVHFSAIKHPILGDKLYGKNSKLIKRHALHAQKIEFNYKNKNYYFETNIPEDIQKVILQLN